MEPTKPSTLPISLPPKTLRPLAFRTFTKKHNLTITSSALQVLAAFVGKYCGSGWREEGLAEKILDEAAKSWKKNGGSVIVVGEGDALKTILSNLESSMSGVKPIEARQSKDQASSNIPSGDFPGEFTTSEARVRREDYQSSLGIAATSIDEGTDTNATNDPRRWLEIVGAFDQPRLIYNVNQKEFERLGTPASLLPDPSHKTLIFRHRYNLIHQRLLRNESFHVSSVASARTSSLQCHSSSVANAQQAYKLTLIANLLGRNGSNHLLLGLLTISPTGNLTLNDLTGSIALDIQHARPVPEDGAWFTPGMIVLIDGMYEEEGSNARPVLDGNYGVGGMVGGKFIAFSVGGPPCERREVTLGISSLEKGGNVSAGGGFGWVDFLGLGSERAIGAAMRRMESKILRRSSSEISAEGRSRLVILGEVNLDCAKIFQALKRVLGLYATEPAEQTPMVFVLVGNFVSHAVITGGGSGGSIEYKEFFDSLASALVEYPTILQKTTFIFVPGDNDPWASAFSAGAASSLPRHGIPELFTSRVKRAFSKANAEAASQAGNKADGKAIWSTNPTRLSLFGPAQEIVLFRDDISGRLRRNAIRFRFAEEEATTKTDTVVFRAVNEESVTSKHQQQRESLQVDSVVETAESHIPASITKEPANSTLSSDQHMARKLVKTVLDQGYLSPFSLSDRPVSWDYAGALHLYPLPSALLLMDSEAPPFAITYEGCHVMNSGSLIVHRRKGVAQWMEYDAQTRRGRIRDARF